MDEPTISSLRRAAMRLREGQLAMHGTQFDQYRVAMCLAASVLEAMVESASTPPESTADTA